MIRRGRFERHRRLPRLHGGKLALLIACLIQTALSVFSSPCAGEGDRRAHPSPPLTSGAAAAASVLRRSRPSLPVNGKIDLDTIRSFRVTLEDEFVQENSIFAPEPDAQDPSADTSARLYADAWRQHPAVRLRQIARQRDGHGHWRGGTISCSIRCSCCPAATCRMRIIYYDRAVVLDADGLQPLSAAAMWPG